MLIALVALVLLGSIAYLLVLSATGEHLVKLVTPPAHATAHEAWPWLVVAILGALAALSGWALSERARRELERSGTELGDSEREAREQAQRAEASARETEERLHSTERRLKEIESERRREREQHMQFARAWKVQRDWNRELREQVAALQHRHGVLGSFDVHEMILRLTVELVEAEKGVLLARRAPDSDDMGVVCAIGFEHDPDDSALAKRFAARAIDRDTTIRVADQQWVEAHQRTAADDEVHNLVAIPMYLRDDFHGVIVCANNDAGFDSFEDELLLAVGNHAGAVLENNRLHGQLRGAYLQTVRTLSSVIEVKDPNLRGHSDAVGEYVLSVADALGFEPQRRERLLFGALLHDVGKVGISERILLKPARLTAEEFSVMQLHPRIGYHLVRQIPALEAIAPSILHHHERFDGTGYPGGLRGEMIPLEARIIAVADAFSAMITERPYCPPMPVADACSELERCAGGQFDPEVVNRFVAAVRERPPEQLAPDPAASDPELELHRRPGSFVLGGSTYGIIDSLTLLYSHRHFHETARAEAQQAALQDRPFTIVVARLHDLPRINAEQGFAAGDGALQSVAEVFHRAAGAAGGTAFRVSGRRIGLIAPGLDEAAGEQLAAGLEAGLPDGVGCSLGMAAWRPGESAEQIIERVTRAAPAPEDFPASA